MSVAVLPLGNPRFLEVATVELFTPDECDRILGTTDDDRWTAAEVESGGGDQLYAGVRPDERSVTHQSIKIDDDGWPLTSVLQAVESVNDSVFRFDLDGIPAHDYPNVLRYEVSTADHFRPHEDVGYRQSTRKLSFSVQLSDPADYQGCDLLFTERAIVGTRERGALTIFPSFIRHTVTPVISGTRFAIVGWVHGPTFR